MTTIKITTKTGDTGESGLANGQRLAKDSTFFEVVGTLDELNSWLGLLAVELSTEFPVQRAQLFAIQDTLFYIGAEVAQSPKAKLAAAKVKELEKWQSMLEKVLEPNWHTKFLLPGGTLLGAHTDIARTVCRRAERHLIAHQRLQPVSPTLIHYLNRLSDYLFLLRCYFNQQSSYPEKEFISG